MAGGGERESGKSGSASTAVISSPLSATLIMSLTSQGHPHSLSLGDRRGPCGEVTLHHIIAHIGEEC
mgnify:CR=1 FL=1